MWRPSYMFLLPHILNTAPLFMWESSRACSRFKIQQQGSHLDFTSCILHIMVRTLMWTFFYLCIMGTFLYFVFIVMYILFSIYCANLSLAPALCRQAQSRTGLDSRPWTWEAGAPARRLKPMSASVCHQHVSWGVGEWGLLAAQYCTRWLPSRWCQRQSSDPLISSL